MTKRSPFSYFKTSPEIIRLAVMMYVRFPLSLRNVEDLPGLASSTAGHSRQGQIRPCRFPPGQSTVQYAWTRPRGGKIELIAGVFRLLTRWQA